MTRVLVVDDHPIVLQGCRRVLEDAGVDEILEAGSVAEANSLFRRHEPDVVIIDLAMHGNGFSGLDLIRRLRLINADLPCSACMAIP